MSSRVLEGDFDPKFGDIREQTYVWKLVNATLRGKDVTSLLLEREAAIYCYYTKASRWMDTIELDPLLELPAHSDFQLTFKNLSNMEHDCVVLLKAFNDQRVIWNQLPEGKAGPGSTFSTGIDIEHTCTLVRLFMATERGLILRVPGLVLH